VEQHSYNDEVSLEIGLSLGGLLLYNGVDRGKKGNHDLFDSTLCNKLLVLSLLKK